MALFTKKDDLAEARALLSKRRAELMASIAEKAESKAAIEQLYDRDAPDEQIRRAEAAHRLVLDHHENLLHATTLADRKVQEIERAAADAAEAKTRVKTDAEIKRHVAALTDAQRSFDKACEALLAASTPVAPYVPEGGIIVNFANQALAEISPITANIVSLMKSHAAAVVAGHAPAALATPEAPAPQAQPAPPQTWTRLIALRDLAWTDDAGHVRLGQRYYTVDLPNHLKQIALDTKAAALPGDPEAQTLRSAFQKPKRKEADLLRDCVPLDDGAAKAKAELTGADEKPPEPNAAAPVRLARPTHTPQPRHAEKILSSHASPFTPMDRGRPYTAQIAAQRSAIDE